MNNIKKTSQDNERSSDRHDRKRRSSGRTYNNELENKMEMEVLQVSRVSCTTAGGRHMSFRASVAIGDGEGMVGIGMGKAKEVPDAINKAERQAKKNLFRIPMYGTTIMYDCEGKSGATKLILKRAKTGTGFITCNTVKSVLRLGGVENLVGKVYGSTNVNNILIALENAIKFLETPKRIASRRGKLLSDILVKNTGSNKVLQNTEELSEIKGK